MNFKTVYVVEQFLLKIVDRFIFLLFLNDNFIFVIYRGK